MLPVLIAVVWGIINILLLKQFLEGVVLQKGRVSLYLLFCVKWPLLYASVYGLLKMGLLSGWDFIIGFSIALGIMTVLLFKKGCEDHVRYSDQ